MPQGSFGYDQNGNQVNGTNPLPFLLGLILGALQSLLGIGGSGSGGVVIASGTGTYTTTHVANNGSSTVPTTAKRWAVLFYGTGAGNTFGTDTAVTAPCSFGDNATPASAINVACDGSSTATIFYSTT